MAAHSITRRSFVRGAALTALAPKTPRGADPETPTMEGLALVQERYPNLYTELAGIVAVVGKCDAAGRDPVATDEWMADVLHALTSAWRGLTVQAEDLDRAYIRRRNAAERRHRHLSQILDGIDMDDTDAFALWEETLGFLAAVMVDARLGPEQRQLAVRMVWAGAKGTYETVRESREGA